MAAKKKAVAKKSTPTPKAMPKAMPKMKKSKY
jgi:hypothetical protein